MQRILHIQQSAALVILIIVLARGRADVIQEVNRRSVNSVSEFQRAVRQAGKQPLVLSVSRRGDAAYIVIQPE
jgi:S1-C subfamily serine protease